ncbi:MAG TPA: hypothetical protein VFH07_01850 [Chitinophagaceae bacterium]|jgi:hypothetical protein|nr:hypothetical protein [Chitinophagaceae bacterium]
MAINKNHDFEELGGVKCAIVERNASKERVAFLKDLLEHNSFEVVVVPSPPPKAATPPKPPPPPTEGDPKPPQTSDPDKSGQVVEPQPIMPETFTIGVTNLAFNPTNAIFGRLLKTKDGHIVTQAYWYQKDSISHDDIPYYEQKI